MRALGNVTEGSLVYSFTEGIQSRKATFPGNIQDLATLILCSVSARQVLSLAGVTRARQCHHGSGVVEGNLAALIQDWIVFLASTKVISKQVRPKIQGQKCGLHTFCNVLWLDVAMSLPSSDSYPDSDKAQLLCVLSMCNFLQNSRAVAGSITPPASLSLDNQILKSTAAECFSISNEVLRRQIRPVENILFLQVMHFYESDISFLNIHVTS